MKTVASKKSQASRAPANGVLPSIAYQKSPQLSEQKSGIRSILSRPFIQRKVVIGQANDSYEREADTVADRVMNNQPAGPISRVGSLGPGPTAQRQANESGEDEKEEEPVQTEVVQRQSESEEEEEPVQSKLIQRQPENEEEAEPVRTKLIQRQSEESGDDEKEEEPVQTKLIQRQSENEEEEEPVQSKLVQRQSENEEEEEPVQTKLIQRQSENEEEEEPVQTKASPTSPSSRSTSMASAASQAIHNKGSGSPLQHNVRQPLESSMGVDLGDVRVHRDSRAEHSNRALHAKAFTHKKDIWLGQNESPNDLRLMAHEVTHVRQQDTVVRRKIDPEQDKEEEENKSSAGKTAPESDTKPVKTEPAEAKSTPVPATATEGGEKEGEAAKEEAKTPSDVDGKKNFDEVIANVGKLTKQQQGVAAYNSSSKKAANKAAEKASLATPKPKGEEMAHGKGKQVGAMAEADKKTGEITKEDKKEFIKLVRKSIAKMNMPKTAFQHMIFVAAGGPAKFKQGVVENVNKKNSEIKSQLQDTTKAEPKSVSIPEPAPAAGKPKKQPGAPRALDIQSSQVLPPPKAPHEVSMESERANFQAQNESDGITTEKLEKANDPRFTAAKESIDAYDQNTKAAPGKYAKIETAELDKERTGVESGEKTASGKMRSKRFGSNKKIYSDQGTQIKKEYKKRDSVKTTLEGIYKKTKESVQPKLDGLEGRVVQCFDIEEKIITLTFNSYVSSEIDKFKDKRYSGFGKAKWLWDKTLGDFNELDAVRQIYKDGVKLYVDLLDKLIDKIAGMVVKTLNSCHKDIDDGITKVNKEIKVLKDTKDTASIEAAKDVLERFKDLRNKVTDKKNELVSSLANKYQSSRKKMNQALEKFKEENRSYREKAGRFIDKVKEAYRQFKKRLSKILARARSAIQHIMDDPIQFLKNMLKAVYQGFNQFKSNIVKHLKTAIFDWMFGSFSRAGVSFQIPTEFSAKSVFGFIMQVLGFTKDWILARAAKVIGKRNVALLEKVYGYVKQLLIQGPAGMYAELKGKVGNLKDTIIDEVRNWAIVQIIKAAIIKLVSMFNPAGAIVQAILTIVDVVMVFANNIDLILKVLETIVDSVYKVVKGNIQGAANMIEKALALGLALAIRFLARFARLSGIVGKIRSIMKRFKRRITRAVDKGLRKIASKVKGLFGRGKVAVKKAAKKGVEAVKALFSVGFKMKGKRHKLTVDSSKKRPKIIMRSTPGELLKKITDAENRTKGNDEAKKRLKRLRERGEETEKGFQGSPGKKEKKRLNQKLSSLTVDIQKFAADFGVQDISPITEDPYEGNVGTYNFLKGKGVEMTPDHEPQNSVMKNLKKIKIGNAQKKVFVGTSLMKYSTGQGICLNMKRPRHQDTRTYGHKGAGTKLETLNAMGVDDPKELRMKGITNKEEGQNKARSAVTTALRRDRAQVISIYENPKWKPLSAKTRTKVKNALDIVKRDNKTKWPEVF